MADPYDDLAAGAHRSPGVPVRGQRRIEPHEYRISFRPFTLGELRERLELAGLREIDTDYGEAADRYAVITMAT